VGKARELADMLGTGVGAILLNTTDENLGQNIFHAGANKVFQAEDNRFKNFDTELYCEKVTELIKEHNPEIFLSPASLTTTDFIPRIAQRLQTGLVSGSIALEIDTMERMLLATCPSYDGKMHEIHACETARPQMIILMPSTFPMPIMDDLRQGKIEKV
jgi:electron transfer flavoprotein alpha subunit